MWLPIEIYQGLPSTAETVLATVPAGQQWVIKEIIIHNTNTTLARRMTIHTRRGGAAADASRRIFGRSLDADASISWPVSTVLNAGAILSAMASVAEVSLTISGEMRTI